MSLSYDDLRPCLYCGAPCDGDLCDGYCERMMEAEQATEDDLHKFEPSEEDEMYCQHCGGSETDHRI
jgi:hypothetical protein